MPTTKEEVIALAKRKATTKLFQLGFYAVSYHPAWWSHGIVVQGNKGKIDIDTKDFKPGINEFLDYTQDNVNICLT